MSDEKEQITASKGGSHFAYHIEVCSVGKKPVRLFGRWYGSEWTHWTPDQTCIPPSQLYTETAVIGLLTYEAAMAIAWSVQARAQSFVDVEGYGIKVRIVQSRLTYDIKAVRTKEFDPIPWRGDGDDRP
jgi:hypothetical protein